ncbi:MAG: hypothetical protein CMG04_07230 [Candidatus Marinimicrobia bacterium]|nr:hypothetical protein [Candidatus Neomarinimicrobiota bacterium]|tara:strand:- start:760 stop:1650 length:891 start_codon:yes stop_codon:yes gene_type:complete
MKNAIGQIHFPVLSTEVVSFLKIDPKGIYCDGTVGLGGHAEKIIQKLSTEGHLIGIDKDENAISLCKKRLNSSRFTKISLFNDSFVNAKTLFEKIGVKKVNGFLLDLGMSSMQLDSPIRGFSFNSKSPLDMRFDVSQSLTANNIVNGFSFFNLANIIYNYGEERNSRRIAKSILSYRPIKNVEALASAINKVTHPRHRNKTLSRVFQAIRIEVNNELKNLEQILDLFIDLLKSGGRIVIISFHSLEDRLVKKKFKKLSDSNQLNVLSKKPIMASDLELKLNTRSRSAKLRAGEKIS